MSDAIRSGLLHDVKDLEPRVLASAADTTDSGGASPDQRRGGDSDASDADADGSDASDTDATDGDSDGSDAADADGTDGDADGTDNA